jgi:hypothetical protein
MLWIRRKLLGALAAVGLAAVVVLVVRRGILPIRTLMHTSLKQQRLVALTKMLHVRLSIKKAE